MNHATHRLAASSSSSSLSSPTARGCAASAALRSAPTMRAMLLAASAALLLAPAFVSAQGAPPARETPRPQDVDPGVNTSAPSQTPSSPAGKAPAASAPTRDTWPQQIDPAVNTSAAAPADSTSGAGRTGAPSAAAAPRSAEPASTPSQSASKATADGKPKGKALDRLELDTTQITGNRELPKVLYIVPWKRSDLGDLTGKPVNSLVDEVLTPVDRDVFKRENRYYRALTPGEGAPANGNAAPTSGAAPANAPATGSASPAARDER